MKLSTVAALATAVALPFLAVPASGQDARDYGYTPSDDIPYHWGDRRRGTERYDPRYSDDDRYYAGRGQPPMPPRSPDRYVTDWDDQRWGRDRRGGADDRWAERPNYDRDFSRGDYPPGYPGRGFDRGSRYDEGPAGGYEGDRRDARGFDPYARERWAGTYGIDDRSGYRDRDFRRDFREDGRRGYYQDPAYEDMASSNRMHDRRDWLDMQRRHGYGMAGHHGQRGASGDRPNMRAVRRAMRMIDMYDTDKDGRVTQEEVDKFRSDRLTRFDGDKDGSLSLAEYERLWLDAMRERMVDQFQEHDADGDGLVTVEEFSARTRNLVRMRDRNGDDAYDYGDLGPRGGEEWRRMHGEDAEAESEDYAGRPEVEAPIDGTPNEPAGTAADDDEEQGAESN